MCTGVRVIEFYSGIGGMRFAFKASGIVHKVVAAVDVNNVANSIYCFNFGHSNHLQRNILSFTPEEVEDMKPDIIVMSPPCQPFTRMGLKMESQDCRTKSFLHLLDILGRLTRKPKYLLIENVMGFETSDVRNILLETLKNCNYTFQEFLLTPLQFGIPNSRLRYYLLAKLHPLQFTFEIKDQVKRELPVTNKNISWKNFCGECDKAESSADENSDICPIHHFLEKETSSYFKKFLLPDKVLSKHASVLDIVNENSRGSCCFTKAYGHYVQGTGSVLHLSNGFEVSSVYKSIENCECEAVRLEKLKSLELRYFTPREISNIMCFPKTFSFPDHITLKQKYKTLGNSVNVFVISYLLQILVSKPE